MASAEFGKYLRLLRERPAVSKKLDIEAMRTRLDRFGGRFPEGVSGTVVDADGVDAEWVDASEGSSNHVLLYLHGGGYVAGSIDSHRNLSGHLAKAAGFRVLALDYRLAPEHPHPAALEDTVAAFRWLVAENYDPSRIAIVGDSAGAGLTVAALAKLRDNGAPLPAAAVLLSPWLDLTLSGESITTRAEVDPIVDRSLLAQVVEAFLGPKSDPCDPSASPLFAELAGLPPILVQVGDHEILLDDSTRLTAKAEAAGIDITLEIWPEMTHVWHTSCSYFPEADRAVANIADFLNLQIA